MQPKNALDRFTLDALYVSGVHLALKPFVGGVGAIFTMHHVRPPRREQFQPNRLLEITPAFLDDVIKALRRRGVAIISLDEMHRRLHDGDFRERFACLTLDDGYRDNLDYAYPIFKKHQAPFAIFVPTSFPDRRGCLWWRILEQAIATHDRIFLVMNGENCRISIENAEQKSAAYEAIYWWLRGLETEDELQRAIDDLAARYSVDIAALCAQLCMDWSDIAKLAADPLCTIGAHTINHQMLRKAPENVARSEMAMSASVIETALGTRPAHLSYPVGDSTSAGPREFALATSLGFKTAVTTRPGILFPEHREHLTALPRISLNGEFQRMRHFRVLESGAATALWNRFARVDAASMSVCASFETAAEPCHRVTYHVSASLVSMIEASARSVASAPSLIASSARWKSNRPMRPSRGPIRTSGGSPASRARVMRSWMMLNASTITVDSPGWPGRRIMRSAPNKLKKPRFCTCASIS